MEANARPSSENIDGLEAGKKYVVIDYFDLEWKEGGDKERHMSSDVGQTRRLNFMNGDLITVSPENPANAVLTPNPMRGGRESTFPLPLLDSNLLKIKLDVRNGAPLIKDSERHVALLGDGEVRVRATDGVRGVVQLMREAHRLDAVKDQSPAIEIKPQPFDDPPKG